MSCGKPCQQAYGLGCECDCGGFNHGSFLISMIIRGFSALSASGNAADCALWDSQARQLTDALNDLLKEKPSELNAKYLDEIAKYFRYADLPAYSDYSSDERQIFDYLNGRIKNIILPYVEQHATASADRKRIAENHFLCSLLVACVDILCEVRQLVECSNIADTIFSADCTSLISKNSADYSSIDQKCNLPLGATEYCVGELLVPGQVKVNLAVLILVFRILAVIICPDMTRHAEVWEKCFRPLLGEACGNGLREILNSHDVSIDVI